jgi:hypothetical protein
LRIAATVAAAVLIAPGTAFAGAVNGSAAYLVVFNNNIENILPPSCGPADWNRLFTHIKAQPLSPDIFAVQQISDVDQLAALTQRMTDELPGTYAARIAIQEPGSMGYTSTCGKLKNQQTNAVIYRSDRLAYNGVATRWRSDAPAQDGSGGCENLTPTTSSQDRVENVGILLHDRVSGQDVAVASVHWPTSTWDGPDCADENMAEANDAANRLGGDLTIVAGDMNTTKGTKGWWNDAMALGFRDPIAETCPSSGCPDSTSTNGTHRIDFMLVKSGNGFSEATTLQESTIGKYSDHRALRAKVKF